MFNKQMGGGSGSASIGSREPSERQIATGLCLIVSLVCGTTWDGVIYQHVSLF